MPLERIIQKYYRIREMRPANFDHRGNSKSHRIRGMPLAKFAVKGGLKL